MKKERAHSGGRQSLDALRTEYAEQRGSGSLRLARTSGVYRRPFEPEAPPSIGWPIWLAAIISLLAFLLAASASVFMGLAALTPLTVSQTVLKLVLLGPVVGGALALPGVVLALLATRRARQIEAGVAGPVTLVWLATALLVAGLLFGGFVTAPRSTLATFGSAIQAHCARLAQSLQPYGNPPNVNTLEQHALDVVATLEDDQNQLPGDQQALGSLTAPSPTYQPLLDDCRALATKDEQTVTALLSKLGVPPDLNGAQAIVKQYESDTRTTLADIQRLGNQLMQTIFTPFQPG